MKKQTKKRFTKGFTGGGIAGGLAHTTDPLGLVKKSEESSARLKYMEKHDLYAHGFPFTKKWKKSYAKAKKGIAEMNKKESWRKYL